MKYYEISVGEDGDVSVLEVNPQALLQEASEADVETFLTAGELMEAGSDPAYWPLSASVARLVIRGEIVVPTPIKHPATFEFPPEGAKL